LPALPALPALSALSALSALPALPALSALPAFTSSRQVRVVDQCVLALGYAFGASQGALALRREARVVGRAADADPS
jgi:hypothetical protein